MKYIDAEKLKEEIERRRKFHDDAVIKFCNSRTIALTHSAGLKEDEELLSLIDSLQQEQPEVDLNADIEMEWDSFNKNLAEYDKESEEVVWLNRHEFNDVAHYFYEQGQHTKYQQDREEFAKLKAKEWINGYDEGYAKGLNARKRRNEK